MDLMYILFPCCLAGGLLGAALKIAKQYHDGVNELKWRSSLGIGAILGLGVFAISYGAISAEWESAFRMAVIALIAGYKNSDFLEDNEKLMDQVLSSKLKELGKQ